MELAIRRSDLVEIDVQRSKDGTLVNFHDCTMEPTTNVEEVYPGRPSYRVSDFTLAGAARARRRVLVPRALRRRADQHRR